MSKNEIEPYLSLYSKLKSKMIKNLNIKPDTVNLKEEKLGKGFELIDTGGIFYTELQWLML
jgi:hypothetical protein